MNLDWDSEQSLGEFGKKLDKFFPKNVDTIVSDWRYEKNKEMNIVAQNHVEKELDDFFKDFGLEPYGHDGLKTTVADLISLYLQYGVPHLSISKLLKEVFQNNRITVGGWDEDRYEYQDSSEFDTGSFNRSVERELEDILGKLEDEQDDTNLKDFVKMVDKISNKYKIDVWYDLPKDDKVMFKIISFERKDGKIGITLRKKGGGEKKDFAISEEGFYRLLYQPELFRLEF